MLKHSNLDVVVVHVPEDGALKTLCNSETLDMAKHENLMVKGAKSKGEMPAKPDEGATCSPVSMRIARYVEIVLKIKQKNVVPLPLGSHELLAK